MQPAILPYGVNEIDSLRKAELNEARQRDRRGFIGSLRSMFRPWRPSAARLHVTELLSYRSDAPIDAWDNTDCKWSATEPVLITLSQFMDWPNHHFLPNDPLGSVFLPSVNEFAELEFMNSIRWQLNAEIGDCELTQMLDSDSTVGQLVAVVLQAARLAQL